MTAALLVRVPTWDLWINQANDTQAFTFPIVNGLKQAITVDGWSGRAQVRKYPNDPDLLHEWSGARTNVIVAGTVCVLLIAPADTLAWDWRKARYDLVLTDLSGKPHRVAEGTVYVSRGTTY